MILYRVNIDYGEDGEEDHWFSNKKEARKIYNAAKAHGDCYRRLTKVKIANLSRKKLALNLLNGVQYAEKFEELSHGWLD